MEECNFWIKIFERILFTIAIIICVSVLSYHYKQIKAMQMGYVEEAVPTYGEHYIWREKEDK